MKKALITGATGFVGYYLLKELLNNHVEVWAICRGNSPSFGLLSSSKKLHIIECSLDDIRTLPEICPERDFDAFFHIAWDGAAGPARADYCAQMKNTLSTCQCIEVAKEMRCAKVVVTGTICEKQVAQMVTDKLYPPSSYYLMAKSHAHEMADVISHRLGIKLVWCHFYHPIGVFNKTNQIIAGTILKMLNGERLSFGPATGLFDVIDVSDLARALFIMGEKELSKDCYMIGSGDPKPLRYYLDTVKDIVAPEAVMEYDSLNTTELVMKGEWLDTSEFEAETGFRPQIGFSQSITDMKEWLENEQEYYQNKWTFIR